MKARGSWQGNGVPPEESKQKHHTTAVFKSQVFNFDTIGLGQTRSWGPELSVLLDSVHRLWCRVFSRGP